MVEKNSVLLSASYGYARIDEVEDNDISALSKLADKRMYIAKSNYYSNIGHDRRKDR